MNSTAVAADRNVQAGTAKIIPFRQKELLLVDNGGEPFVPMKPIVEGMGLAWQVQHRKLVSGRFAPTITMMVIVAEDGKKREMACLPLRKLAGWLMSIHASKVRPDLRDNVIAYQNECDDALWAYWNEGIAVRHDDRSAASVLGTTIGTDGFHCLAAVLDGKVRRLPAKLRAGAKNRIWSQVRKGFSVTSVEDIPADKLDSARNFIAAYAVEGEWLGKAAGFTGVIGRPLKQHERFMLCLDHTGAEQCKEIPNDAYILSFDQFIRAMLVDGDMPVSTEEMFGFMTLAMQNLQGRSRTATAQLRELRRKVGGAAA